MAVPQKKLAKAVNKARKTGNKHKFSGRNNGPSRQRYWAGSTLMKRKLKNLMRHNGMTREVAWLYWKDARKGRMKK